MGASSLVFAKGPSDPVLMTVGGKPVTLSEFEYLYHKNNAQQSTPQDIEEYLKLFVPYRQKVAAAEDAGLDKSEAFEKEFATYRHDLAAPYMIDQAVEDSILAAQYERMKEEVDVSHIMVFFQAPGTPEQKKALMDSLLTCINAGESFDSLAIKYSGDQSSARRGGRMGFITANRFPVAFEDAAYTTPVGEHTGVITTPFGYHIVKVNDRRPARGQVLVEHILRLTRGKSEAEAQAQKQYIDSLYTMVTTGGASFEAVAAADSEDPGSASQGGLLPWFGPGQMVPEFEEVAYSLADSTISKPFATSYGYHIIRRLQGKGIESFDQAKTAIKNVISRDERGQLASRRRLDQLKKQFGIKADEKNLAKIKKQIENAGGVDSVMMQSFLKSNQTVAYLGKEKLPLSEMIAQELPNGFAGPVDQQLVQFDEALSRYLDGVTVEAKEKSLMADEPAYRNLVNEYRDGMLMFEIQDQHVWSKAKSDKEGLEEYFKAHRDNYRWDSPRFKSRIIFADNDSILGEVNKYIADNKISDDSLSIDLRKKFGKAVKIERVLAAKGENPITDYLGFNGDKPVGQNGRWSAYEAYKPQMIEQPEEAADVRGVVITDYQDYLLSEWLKELDSKYPAVVDKKVLQQAK